jgi:hypothetical protein
LLGIGGGIIMFPLLLYLPPILGFEIIDIKSITGLTMIQGFFASATAMLFYNKQGLVSKPLVFTLGPSLFLSSLSGAIISKVVPDRFLLFIFGVLCFIAAVAMLVPRSYSEDDLTEDKIYFNKSVAIITGVFVGFFLGLVGQGGAFIIGLFSSTAGLIGKAATGQVPFLMTVALLLGAIPAARLGVIIGRNTKVQILRWLLAFMVSATAVKIWTSIL